MRHFLVDDDLNGSEQLAILDLADTLKASRTGCVRSPVRGRLRFSSTKPRRGPESPSRLGLPSWVVIR